MTINTAGIVGTLIGFVTYLLFFIAIQNVSVQKINI